MNCRRTQEDFVESRSTWWLFWGGPVTLLIVAMLLPAMLRAILWALCFSVMGAACVANATRCRRLHCYFTGPIFLAAALATVLSVTGILYVPWTWIGTGTAGVTLLACLAERVSGRYLSPGE